MDDWGGDHWWPQIGLRAPLAMVSVLLTWSGGVISSDSICHKSLTLGNVNKLPFYLAQLSLPTLYMQVLAMTTNMALRTDSTVGTYRHWLLTVSH